MGNPTRSANDLDLDLAEGWNPCNIDRTTAAASGSRSYAGERSSWWSEALAAGGCGWPVQCRRVRAANVSFLEIQLGPGTAGMQRNAAVPAAPPQWLIRIAYLD
jgi:hypothetical protein